MKLKYFLSALTLSILSTNAMALVDRDSDGLIEINNLDDLNEMRNDVFGKTLRDDSSGCPADTGCFGYELTRNLDIGSVNWVPIGEMESPFSAEFNGNGHTINNLKLNSVTEIAYSGFFGVIDNAEIKNIGLLNPNVVLFDGTAIGGLIGHAKLSTISNCYVKDGEITSFESDGYAGGLIGHMEDSSLNNSYFASKMGMFPKTGGLVGLMEHSTINGSYAKGQINSFESGGLVYHLHNSGIANSFSNIDLLGGGLVYTAHIDSIDLSPEYTTISNSYAIGPSSSIWGAGLIVSVADDQPLLIKNSFAKNEPNLVTDGSTDSISVEKSYWVKDPEGTVLNDSGVAEGSGQLLTDMQCASNPINNNCAKPNLFKKWDKDVWDFGTESQLPALKLKTNFPWYSTDTSGSTGDYESIARMKEHKPEYACDTPSYFYAKEKKSGYVFNAKTPEVFRYFYAQRGFACVNADQSDSLCHNYEVAYLCKGADNWTDWKSKDIPNDGSNGDYEPYENECGNSSTPVGIRIRKIGAANIYYGAPQKLKTFNLAEGLRCVNDDNSGGCKDYEVRMTCELLGDRESIVVNTGGGGGGGGGDDSDDVDPPEPVEPEPVEPEPVDPFESFF